MHEVLAGDAYRAKQCCSVLLDAAKFHTAKLSPSVSVWGVPRCTFCSKNLISFSYENSYRVISAAFTHKATIQRFWCGLPSLSLKSDGFSLLSYCTAPN